MHNQRSQNGKGRQTRLPPLPLLPFVFPNYFAVLVAVSSSTKAVAP